MTTKTTTKKEVVMKVTEAPIYSVAGKEVGTFTLPKRLFGAQLNKDLIHQVATSMELNARATIANSKHRGEVRGGGKKPWKQKGTGRARHGSSRSPIWVGGGTTHGPRKEVVYTNKINRKMKAAALASLLTAKFNAGEVFFVDSLEKVSGKTKEASVFLSALAKATGQAMIVKKTKNAVLVALSKKQTLPERGFRNIANVATEDVRNLNVVDMLNKKFVIIENPVDSSAVLLKKFNSTNA